MDLQFEIEPFEANREVTNQVMDHEGDDDMEEDVQPKQKPLNNNLKQASASNLGSSNTSKQGKDLFEDGFDAEQDDLLDEEWDVMETVDGGTVIVSSKELGSVDSGFVMQSSANLKNKQQQQVPPLRTSQRPGQQHEGGLAKQQQQGEQQQDIHSTYAAHTQQQSIPSDSMQLGGRQLGDQSKVQTPAAQTQNEFGPALVLVSSED